MQGCNGGAMTVSANEKRRRSQWGAQFLVASELVRRGYLVSFTMGNNTPDADLIVGKPRGKPFWIDVKGQSSKQAWLISPKTSEIPNLFYVLVYLSPLASDDAIRCPDSFFVLSQADVGKLSAEYLKAHPGDKNKVPGFGFNDPREFRNAWRNLPDSGAEISN
jgi:hypothetical protein